ncbi:MAG: putative bifunctional diguanylate cyclase/phosphodiesterase, partial [Methylomonas sp.]
MSENPDKHGERKTLRDQAEKQLGGQPAPGTTASPNEKMLLHELQVHQIELEMQNEALQQAQDAERTSLARYTELFDFAPIAYFNLAQDGSILQTNLCGARLLGRDRSDLVGRPLLHFVCEPNRPAFTSLLHNVLAGHEPITCEVCLETAIATSWVRIEGTPDRQQHGYLLAVMDITDRKRAEKLLYKQALIDPLTELPNRRLFLDRLDHAIQKCQRDRQKLAVLFLDLDRFKDINDTLGHDIGDKLLKEASGRLKKCIRETDTLARPGGDEFILILEELNETDSAERVAQNLLHSMEAPFHLGKEYCYISISIGMTFYPDDARETIDLLKKADQAMYAAKLLGRNQLRHFTPAMQSAAEQRLRLSNDLRQALADNQLLLNYQPIVDLATGSIRK